MEPRRLRSLSWRLTMSARAFRPRVAASAGSATTARIAARSEVLDGSAQLGGA